jgi:hypothetical protein
MKTKVVPIIVKAQILIKLYCQTHVVISFESSTHSPTKVLYGDGVIDINLYSFPVTSTGFDVPHLELGTASNKYRF